jgi:putative glutamine amidotransferase
MRPLILINPSKYAKGQELYDAEIAVAQNYYNAILAAGGLPWVMPRFTAPELAAEYIARADGLMLTGGDDINPSIYGAKLTPELEKTVCLADPERDLQEFLLIEEIFRQQKPIFGICRGHQVLNVALGGTLIVDIPQQIPGALEHNRSDARFELVHDVQLAPESLLARIVGNTKLGANSSHHQSVGRVAKPLKVSGRTADGVIEALELSDQEAEALPYLLTVQAHPERLFDRHPEHLKLFQSFVTACAVDKDRRK